jgi:N-acetylglutamate synthase-like GNAT family acetyltransferase
VYCEYDWDSSKIHRKPQGYWNSFENQRKFMEGLGKKLGFTSMDHWYDICSHNILENGGKVLLEKFGAFFARDNDGIIGTAALIKHDSKTYELAKMAVTEKAQGRQIGKKLAQAVINKARDCNADVLFLETNAKLIPAMNLYKKLGFIQTAFKTESKYRRATIKMELKLT